MKLHLSITFACVALAASATPTFVNPSFETPNVGGSYQYNPSGAGVGWTFLNGSGVSNDLYAPAPNGSQEGFLQECDGQCQAGNFTTPSISQTVTGLTVGETYDITFSIAQRGALAGLPFNVTLGALNLETNLTPGSATWTQITTPSFIASQSSMLLSFTGDFTGSLAAVGEVDAGIDNVVFNDLGASSAPEPSTFALLALSVASLGVVALRKTRVL